MFEENDLLTETFVAHTQVVPDTDDVLARIDAIARTHRRNRWVVRATGVSLVSAGLVVGGIALPGLLSSGANHNGRSSVVAEAGGTSTDSAYTTDQEMTAYFQGGYDYNNAVELSRIWNKPIEFINKVKAEAGLKLLEGQPLPVQPDGPPATPADKAVTAFFDAGYDYNDAVKLAGIWHDSTPYQAKVEGGQKLEQGESLPIPPSGDQPSGTAGPVAVSRTGTSASAGPASVRRKLALARRAMLKREEAGGSKGAALKRRVAAESANRAGRKSR
jgi:hypothetical protein